MRTYRNDSCGDHGGDDYLQPFAISAPRAEAEDNYSHVHVHLLSRLDQAIEAHHAFFEQIRDEVGTSDFNRVLLQHVARTEEATAQATEIQHDGLQLPPSAWARLFANNLHSLGILIIQRWALEREASAKGGAS